MQSPRKSAAAAKPRKPSATGYIKPGGPLFGDEIALFDKVTLDILHGNRAMFDKLTAHEREQVVTWLGNAVVDERGGDAITERIWEVDFKQQPVGIKQFVTDPYYMGRVLADLHPRWLEDLEVVFAPGSPVFEWVFTGGIGTGKGIAADDVVLTPTGWQVARDVRVGGRMIGRDGTATRVLGVFPRGRLLMYRVTLDDGTSVRVDGDHLWSVQTPKQKYAGSGGCVKATRDLVGDFRLKSGSKKWHIPVVSVVEFDAVDLPLDAYALGALLGDGGLTGGGIKFSSNDVDMVEDVACRLGLMPRYVGTGCDYRLVAGGRGRGPNPVLDVLRDLGACVLSHEKFVPEVYLRASAEARLALLRGLMDTDGWYEPRCKNSYFCSTSLQLANAVASLARSLGGSATVKLKKTTHLDAYNVHVRLLVNPFLLPRKAHAWTPATKYPPRRMIADIVEDGEDEVICFQVDAEDELFVVRDFIVTHNTTISCAGIVYKLYLLSCMRDPSRYYGLMSDLDDIIFGVYSITKQQVVDTGYSKLRGYIDTSPYFRTEFPRNTKIDSKIDFKTRTGCPLTVISGSQELHALGLNMFTFLMDEVNFMRVKNNKEAGKITGQAYGLYNATYKRMISRFQRPGGTLPGMMFLISSKAATTSFLDEHLAKVRDSNYAHCTHVSDYALWECKPKSRFAGFDWFSVEVGDRVSPSRILKPLEEPRPGARVIKFPGTPEIRRAVEDDVDQALRDIAGIATFNVAPLIRDRKSVLDCVHDTMVHPFTREAIVIDVADDVQISEFFLTQAVCRSVQGAWLPRLNPNAPRFVHVDIGLTGDCAGIAVAHVAGTTRQRKENPIDGTVTVVANPYVIVDFMLRIVPPPGSEIDLSKIRAFLAYLTKNSLFPILRVTFDGFQGRDSMQILVKQGIEAGYQSVDRDDEAYLSLRAAMADRRIAMYGYTPFQDEVLDLERTLRRNNKGKVDHPARASKGGKGSKDVADAVAGAVYMCMQDPRAVDYDLPEIDERVSFARHPNRKRAADDTSPNLTGTHVVGGAEWDELGAQL